MVDECPEDVGERESCDLGSETTAERGGLVGAALRQVTLGMFHDDPARRNDGLPALDVDNQQEGCAA